MPKYRKKLTSKKSKKDFTRKSGTHKKNRAQGKRGGIRL